MTPDESLASYRAMISEVGEPILIRRFTGAGAPRPKQEAWAMARPFGLGSPELVGGILQGKSKWVVLNDPSAAVPDGMVSLQSLLPLSSDDKLVAGGKELAIDAIDDKTRRIAGVIIALEIQVIG